MKKISIIVFIIFAFLALVIGINHEPWADEAQSWIIARDASVGEIIWDISRYEGTFPLWFLTIKLFISLGLQYEYFFIIPIIISLIGLLVFLKGVKAPTIVKVLVPFTYYIFYQYTIVARSYCYLFLALSIWAIYYKDREKKFLQYTLSLVLLSMISMHGMVISGVLGILFVIELINKKKVKEIVSVSTICLCTWIIECIVLLPRMDLYMNVALSHSVMNVVWAILSTIFVGSNIIETLFSGIGVALTIIMVIYLIRIKEKSLCITSLCVIAFMCLIRLVSHHLGIIYLVILFGVLVNYDLLKSKYKLFERLFITMLVLYISYTGISSINDFKGNYSAAKQIATYIEENNIDKSEIYRFGYKQVAILPYFESNLFANTEKTIYEWKQSNTDFYDYVNFDEEMIKEKNKDSYPEYILVEKENTDKISLINEIIQNTGKYDLIYSAEGKLYYKNTFVDTENFNLYKLINNN